MNLAPRIAVIGTGGSLSTPGRHALDLFEYGEFSKPVEVDELLGMFAGVLSEFDLVPVGFCAIDSAAADPALWLDLNRQISRTVASDPSIAGIVITHGTSALEETAYFLHLTVKVDV